MDISQYIKNLPAPVRHFAAIFVGTAAAFFIGKIVQAGTIYGFNYAEAALQAVDAGVLAALSALLVLYVTPLTNAYGVCKTDPEVDDTPESMTDHTNQLPDPVNLENPAPSGQFERIEYEQPQTYTYHKTPEVLPAVEPARKKTVKKPEPKPATKKTVKGTVKKAVKKVKPERVKTNPYERIWWRGFAMDRRTVSALEWVEKKTGQTIIITQGSYNPGGVSASGGTHDGGGVVDIRTIHLSRRQRVQLMHWLKKAGFAAWYRKPPVFPYHIHAVLLDHRSASPAAKAQMVSYLNHRNGLVGDAYDKTFRPKPAVRWSHRQNKPVKR